MVVVSVSYPASEGSHFDLDYYQTKHMPLVRERWSAHGLTETRLIRGTGGMAGGALAFHMVALLSFATQEGLDAGLQAHGREIMGDIKNFSNVRPLVQLNEELS